MQKNCLFLSTPTFLHTTPEIERLNPSVIAIDEQLKMIADAVHLTFNDFQKFIH